VKPGRAAQARAWSTMTDATKPPQQNPALPDFWDHRFRAGFTPWDAGRVPDALRAFVAGRPAPGRVLVPGCGSGWEVRYLADRGFDVIGLDFSAAALDAARINVGAHADRLVQADYFAYAPAGLFDTIYERTFLCALPRRLWPRYAERTAALLRPGGLLAGFFYFADEPKGPPFGARPEALDALLAPWFRRDEDSPVADSIALFRGRERWQVWRRRVD
jgi:SAM-dependent methyltransferase